MRGDALSDFEVMWSRLIGWGRWGRQDSCRPDPESVTAGIYDMGKDDERELDEDAAPEDSPEPINSRDAENLDGYIMQLRQDHRRHIRVYFYKRQHVYRPLLDEAVRAMCDAEEHNQRVNQRMRR